MINVLVQFPLRPYFNFPCVASHQFISTKMNLTYIPINSSKVYLTSLRPYKTIRICWKEMFGGVEAGTVVANPLYYQEEDNGV